MGSRSNSRFSRFYGVLGAFMARMGGRFPNVEKSRERADMDEIKQLKKND